MEADLYEWFDRVVSTALDGKEISEWERTFLNDQHERIIKYGRDVRMSSKQWGVISRVAEKIGLEEMPGPNSEE